MKRKFVQAILCPLGILVAVALNTAIFFPATVSADACTDKGQWTTTAGSCCPANQVQIANNQVSCNNTDSCNGDNVSNDQAFGCLLKKYINPAISLLSAAVAVIVVITIVRGALTYTSSAGDPSKAAAGKQHIINALIGLAAYLMLYVFLQFIIPGGILN
jgi:hypothetical protein